MTTTEQIPEEIKTMQAKLDALMAARARTEARTDMGGSNERLQNIPAAS